MIEKIEIKKVVGDLQSLTDPSGGGKPVDLEIFLLRIEGCRAPEYHRYEVQVESDYDWWNINILGVRFIRTDTITILKQVMAETAEDIMFDPVSIKMEDSLTHALRKMVQAQVEELPVIDEHNHVIGDLNCFEMISGLREAGAKAAV